MPIMVTNVRTLPSTDVGGGGVPFAYQAPYPGFALVGFILRARQWIDSVTPIFAELQEDGTLGPDVYGQSYGGPGGRLETLRVETGYVVTGIQSRSGYFVDALRLLQARWVGNGLDTSGHRWTPWVGGLESGSSARIERFVEPYGAALAIGIAGRAERYLDSLTLISGELVGAPGAAIPKSTIKPTRAAG